MQIDLPTDCSTYTKDDIYGVISSAFTIAGTCKFYLAGIKCEQCPFIQSDKKHCNLVLLRNMGIREGRVGKEMIEQTIFVLMKDGRTIQCGGKSEIAHAWCKNRYQDAPDEKFSVVEAKLIPSKELSKDEIETVVEEYYR